MSAPSTTPTTNFESSKSWYGGRECIQIRQRVVCSAGARIVPLGGNVPAYARVIAASILNTIVPTVSGTAGTVTADSIALMMYPVSNSAATTVLTASPVTASVSGLTVAAPTVTQPVSSSGIILAQTPGIGTSPTNGRYRGAPLIERVNTNNHKAENPYQAAALLALVPAGLSSNITQVSTSAITTGYCFGTALTETATQVALVDVVAYIETYDDYWS